MNGTQNRRQSGKRALPSTSPFVRFYPFADGGVLFREGTRRIWALNGASACIWCLLEEASDLDGLAGMLAGTFSIDRERARQDAAEVVASFAREGLLAGGAAGDDPEEEGGWDITPQGPPAVDPPAWAVRRLFRTPHQVFEFCCADVPMGEAFAGNLAHLFVEGEATADTRLAVLPAAGGTDTWDVFLDGRRYVGGVPRGEVLPYLTTLVFIRACEVLGDFLLFHAAVLERGGEAVLFPADAGSGKSTLSAALAARGYGYLSDELAVLDLTSLRVVPFTLPISIKSGSTEVLKSYYPRLPGLPLHLRVDSQRVRYLSPPKPGLWDADGERVPVRALVFPRYLGGEGARLVGLEKAAALQRLAWTGSSNREFTPADVRAMIATVERCPCFELTYGDLEEAMSLLDKHVFAPEAHPGDGP